MDLFIVVVLLVEFHPLRDTKLRKERRNKTEAEITVIVYLVKVQIT